MSVNLTDGAAEALHNWLQQWPDGLLGLDASNYIRCVSAQAENLLGWASEHLIGQHAHDVLCLKTRDFLHDRALCPLCQPYNDPSQVASTNWLNADGYVVSIDFRVIPFADGHIQKIVSFQSNQERAHNFEETSKLLGYVENNPAPIAEFDINGQVLFGNSAFNRLLLQSGFNDQGQSRILPFNLAQICHDCLSLRKVYNGVEVEVDQHWFNWHFAPLDREESALVGYAFDISEQKHLQLLDVQEKARARRDFYAKMVHELRTPLNAIIGFSQVLLRRLATSIDDRELANLRAIKTAGLQLNQMISNTLELSKIDAGKMEVECSQFSVHAMFESVSEQLASLANAKGLRYSISCGPDFVMNSDLDKVRQIMVNLLSNAIKYTHRGEVGAFVSPGRNGELIFAIRDTGIGISQPHLAGLFDVYGRIRGQNTQHIQGTGLGLALVAEFVEMLKGEITVRSQLDQGTTFEVRLPMIYG